MIIGRRSVPRAAAWFAAVAAAVALAGCAEDSPQTTFRPVTDFGILINEIFVNTFWWTMAVLVVVQAVLLYIVVRFRARPGQAKPKQVHGNVKLEILWTVIPAIIVAFIAVPTVRGIFATQQTAPQDALVIDVIGHQWWWEFRYAEYGIVTANQFHLPAGRPVALRMRSADVIHSFWVPRLGGKRDVNPAPARIEGEEAVRYNWINFTAHETGWFPGQCAEFCGLSHGVMRTMAVVLEPAEFEAWVEAMRTPVTPAPGTVEARGQELFTRSVCIACHTVQGTTAAGVLGPNLTRMGERWTIGAGALPLSRDNMAAWLRDPMAIKPGTLMPGAVREGGGMPATHMSDEDIDAIAAYLVSLRGEGVRLPAAPGQVPAGADAIPDPEPAAQPAAPGDDTL
jgi:cytochrome c oxidase subunit II